MSSGSRVIETWGERTDATAARAEAVFRSTASAGLTPLSGKGGGKSAVDWFEPSLVNHGTGMAVAFPATAAATLVPKYRALHFYERTIERLTRNKRQISWTVSTSKVRKFVDTNHSPDKATNSPLQFYQDSLGDVLEALIVCVAKQNGATSIIETAGLNIGFLLGRPAAFISFKTLDGERITDHYLMGKEHTDRDYWGKSASISLTSSMRWSTIEMLADLLRDSLQKQIARTPSSIGSAEGSASALNEEAGSLPGEPASSEPLSKCRSGDILNRWSRL